MDKYSILGLSVVVIIGLFLVFSDDDMMEYDYSGIVSDIEQSRNGYTFSIQIHDGTVIRCYYSEIPIELGYYSVKGNFSDDGTIFFVSAIRTMD